MRSRQKTLQELVQWMKAKPESALLGTAGIGSPAHIAGAFLQKLTDTKLQFVHYRGGAPSMQGLLGGEIELLCPQPPIVLPLARDGKIRAYAVTAKKRMAIAPEIPTAGEAAEPGFDVSVWHGFWAPKGTPKPIVASLNAAIVDALADPAVMKSLGDAGQDIPPRDEQTPEAFGAFQKAEVEKCGPSSKRRILKQSSLAKTPAKEYRPSAPHCRFVALRAASAPLGS